MTDLATWRTANFRRQSGVGSQEAEAQFVRPNRKLTEDELQRVYGALYPGARRIFVAFCETGARLNEIRNCNVCDADLNAMTLRVIGKRKKERLIPINNVLLETIREELAGRPNALPSAPLFLNREGRRYRSLRTPLTTACGIAGVKHFSHHSLRHSYATLMHKSGRNIVLISKILGHVHPTVTQNIYVDPLPEDVRQAGMSFSIDVKKGQKRCK